MEQSKEQTDVVQSIFGVLQCLPEVDKMETKMKKFESHKNVF